MAVAAASLCVDSTPIDWARRGNASLSDEVRWIAFGVLACAPLIILLVASALRLWWIVPFAGLEIAALALAFHWVGRQANAYERLRVHDGVLSLESRHNGRWRQGDYNCAWAVLEQVGRGERCDLFVRYAGRRHPVAQLATDAERRALAERLARVLTRVRC
jgi:uncharacterized membrane protein